jgi:erythromycin esterase
MIKNLLTSLFLLIVNFSFAQLSIQQYIESEKKSIRTVNPADEDYTDLEAFGKAVEDKRVVMLGEQDHGDAPAFLAKTRLIKYLYEKKGFTVLAFESDFFGLTQGQVEIQNDSAMFRKYMQRNIFSLWWNCDASTTLFYDFLPKKFISKNPILVTGFDSQPHSGFSRRLLVKYLDSVINKESCPLQTLSEIKKPFLTWTDSIIKKYGQDYGSIEGYSNYTVLVDSISNAYAAQNGNNYTWLLLQNLKAYNLQKMYWKQKKYAISNNTRDAAMAANLHWLVNDKYKNEKVIIWAHNYHIMNKSIDAMGADAGGHYSMGNEFLKDSTNKKQTYILGFCAKEGKAGRLDLDKKYNLKGLKKNAGENWFGEGEYAFIDFSTYNKSMASPEYFILNGKGHNQPASAQWTKCFDGLFYLRNMYPCKPLY